MVLTTPPPASSLPPHPLLLPELAGGCPRGGNEGGGRALHPPLLLFPPRSPMAVGSHGRWWRGCAGYQQMRVGDGQIRAPPSRIRALLVLWLVFRFSNSVSGRSSSSPSSAGSDGQRGGSGLHRTGSTVHTSGSGVLARMVRFGGSCAVAAGCCAVAVLSPDAAASQFVPPAGCPSPASPWRQQRICGRSARGRGRGHLRVRAEAAGVLASGRGGQPARAPG